VLIALALVATGLTFAALWLRSVSRCGGASQDSVALAAVAMVVGAVGQRRVAKLGSLREPHELVPRSGTKGARPYPGRRWGFEVHLAPEDPRRVDLDRKAIAKAPPP